MAVDTGPARSGTPVPRAPDAPDSAAGRSGGDRRGLLHGAAAYGLWGLFPLYWPLLEPAGATEVLAHRIVWSLAVVLGILAVQRRWSWVRDLRRQPAAVAALALAAVVIAVNWGTYIWGVTHDHVVETSLGYFVNPLVSVVFGVAFLGERLRRVQWVAVGIGAAAVLVLAVDYGRPPWIALVLAFSFATYGLLKKKATVGPVESLTVETAVLFVPALVWLLVLDARDEGTFGHGSLGHTLLLTTAGVVTAVPLLYFGSAARTVPLTTLGLLQYLAPTLQFLLGVTLFGEPMPPVRIAGFCLVWTALVVFTVDAVRHHRRDLARSAESLT